MDANALLFGIQFVCLAIALIIGNTTGDWGTAALIGIGGFIGGLIIGNIYGEISDRNFKEKMEKEQKYNEEHAFEIASKRFQNDSFYYHKRKSLLTGDRRNKYTYIDWSKSYDVEKDIDFLDHKPYDEAKINDLATYLLRGDKDFLYKFIEEYEHSWKIKLTDEEKKKLVDIAYTGNDEKYKEYQKEIKENKKKAQKHSNLKPEKDDIVMPLFGYEDDITVSSFDDEEEATDYSYVRVFHITDKKNLGSIEKTGIKSRNEVESNLNFVDIADQDVENNHRKVIIKGHSIDSYARCFFNPLPPMYHRRKDTNNLCIIELKIPFTISERTIGGERTKYFDLDIDAAKDKPIALSEGVTWNRWNADRIIEYDLTKIHWKTGKILDGDNKKDILAKRSAELLVYPEIPAKYISKIYCNDGIHASISELNNISNSGKVSICYD